MFGIAGKLGTENALRNPRRTSATASALMIGLAFVTLATVLASSVTASAYRLIDEGIGADYVVASQQYFPFSPQVARDLARVDGVDTVAAVSGGQVKIGGRTAMVTAITPGTAERVLNLAVRDGSEAALRRGELLVDAHVAAEQGWRVGAPVPVVFAATGSTTLRVGGTYEPNQFAGPYLLSTATYDAHFAQRLDTVVMVTRASGADREGVHRALLDVVHRYPGVQLKDQTQVKADYKAMIDRLLLLVFGLLFLAILIAVLGIVNTLALSVFERTHEIGLLRAVGMSRRQLRRMVRLESVTISAFGALLGVGVGVAFGWAVVSTMRDEGIEVLRIPVAQLALYVVLAALVGVLAALWPARRAARMDVLAAIATE